MLTMRLGLEPFRALLGQLDHPQRRFPSVVGRRDQRQGVRHPVSGIHHVLLRPEDRRLHFAPCHPAGGAVRGGREADLPAGIRRLLQPGGGDHPASRIAIPSHLFRDRDRDGFPVLRPPPGRSGHPGSGDGRPAGQHQRGGPPAFRHHPDRAGSPGAVGEHGGGDRRREGGGAPAWGAGAPVSPEGGGETGVGGAGGPRGRRGSRSRSARIASIGGTAGPVFLLLPRDEIPFGRAWQASGRERGRGDPGIGNPGGAGV